MQIKHNKLKNTGILFELLVRQITSDTLSNKNSKAVDIIKQYFRNTELSKEYKIYQTLISTKTLNENKANQLVDIAIDMSSKLNKSNLRKQKYNLIKSIKEAYNIDEFFKFKINQYKEYAAIYNLLEAYSYNEFVEPSLIINNKCVILEHITKKEIIKENVENEVMEEYLTLDKGTRNIVYKNLLENYNNKYDNLCSEQKNILKEYINCVSNTNTLKEFVNNQIFSIKNELKRLSFKVQDKTVKIKLDEIISMMNPLDKNVVVKDEHILGLLQHQELINELKNTK